jgi:hypothetical protein
MIRIVMIRIGSIIGDRYFGMIVAVRVYIWFEFVFWPL